MAGLSIRMQFEPQRSLAFGSISGAYMGVGSAVSHPLRQFIIQNLTDATIQFSFNGIDDHFPLPAGGLFIDDITSNKAISQGFFLAEGERLYAKTLGSAPTTGAVYFSAIYGREI